MPPAAEQRRQIFDVPPRAVVVTEHRAAQIRCPRCRHHTAAPFPPGMTQPAQYSPRVKALGVYLLVQQLLPYERAGEVLADLLDCPLAAGTRHAAVTAGAAAMAPRRQHPPR